MGLSDFLKKHRRKLLALGLVGIGAGIGAGIGFKRGIKHGIAQRNKEIIKKRKVHNTLNNIMKYGSIASDSIPDGVDDFIHSPENSGTFNYHIIKRMGKNMAPEIAKDVGSKIISKLVYRNHPDAEIKRMDLEDNIDTAANFIQSGRRMLKNINFITSLNSSKLPNK